MRSQRQEKCSGPKTECGQKKTPEKSSSLTKEQNCYTVLYKSSSWQNQGIRKVKGGICVPILHGKHKNSKSERCVTLEVVLFDVVTADKRKSVIKY